jgi:hypothetical protein
MKKYGDTYAFSELKMLDKFLFPDQYASTDAKNIKEGIFDELYAKNKKNKAFVYMTSAQNESILGAQINVNEDDQVVFTRCAESSKFKPIK